MRAGLLWLGLIGCTADKAEDSASARVEVDPLDWPVGEVGPYGVGYRSFDWSYSPGVDFADRTIRINLWYPTEDTEGPEAAYTVGIDSGAIEDAALADSVYSGGHPVHVHSHGYRGYGATSAFLARYFASHGIVTVAPDHTNNTLIDHSDPLGAAHYFHRPLDIRAALDALEAEGGPMNTAMVMLSGHSFGSYTSWAVGGAVYDPEAVAAVCATGEGIHADGCTPEEAAMFGPALADSRVVSVMPMAGTISRTWFGSAGEYGVGGPVLFFGGSNDDVGQDTQFEEMGEIDFTWMELEGGCHQSFALGACSTLDPALGFELVQTIALAFVRLTVLGDTSGESADIVAGDLSLSDIVTTWRRTGG
jgi:predicted dienelactone hydrolase